MKKTFKASESPLPVTAEESISLVQCDFMFFPLKVDMSFHLSSKTSFADGKARILDLNLPCQKCSKKKTSSSESLILSSTQTQQFPSWKERIWGWKQVQGVGERDEEAHFSNFLWKLAKEIWIIILNRSKCPQPKPQKLSSILISLLHLDFCVSNYDKVFWIPAEFAVALITRKCPGTKQVKIRAHSTNYCLINKFLHP